MTQNKNTYRLLNRDGTFNIERSGMRRSGFRDLYHSLLSSSFLRFFSLLLAGYLIINLFFGTLYFLCGPGALEGVHREGSSILPHFIDCFFFSVQTLATIGYGRISPVSIGANLLVTVEALLGMLSIALATGLLFARFSRPTARVMFSDKAIIASIDGLPHLLFRMANARLNQIVEAQVDVVLLIDELTAEGESFRNLIDLKLDRAQSPVFTLSWSISHAITPESPLYGKSLEDLRNSNAEFFVSVTGIDETFSQSIHARYSYTADDLVLNGWFEDVLERTPDQKVRIHLERLSALREQGSRHRLSSSPTTPFGSSPQ